MERFKKGQLIPKRLNIIDVKKARHRHLFTFGCDVEVTGKEIKCLTHGCVIYGKRSWIGGKNGKPREYSRAALNGVMVIGFIEKQEIRIRGYSLEA